MAPEPSEPSRVSRCRCIADAREQPLAEHDVVRQLTQLGRIDDEP